MTTSSIRVTFMNGPADGRHIDITNQRATVGRSTDCDVVIDFDPSIALNHMEITYNDDQWWLIDKSEALGITVDGDRIHGRTALDHRVLVILGNTQLEVDIRQP